MTNLHNYHDFALMIPAFFSLLQGIILVSTAVSSCEVFGGLGVWIMTNARSFCAPGLAMEGGSTASSKTTSRTSFSVYPIAVLEK